METQQARLPEVSSRGEIRKMLGIFNLCRAICPKLARALKLLQTALTAPKIPSEDDLQKMAQGMWKFILENKLRVSLEKDPVFFSIKVD